MRDSIVERRAEPPTETEGLISQNNSSFINILRGTLFAFSLILSGISCYMLVFPAFFLSFIRVDSVVRIRDWYYNLLCILFFNFGAAIFKLIGGIDVVIHSHCPHVLNDARCGLIISNHRNRMDGQIVGWSYGSIMNVNDRLRVIIKDALRSLPLFGWMMQILVYIFLSRDRTKDVSHIQNVIAYHLRKGMFSLLLFPEGTDLSPSNLENSLKFQRERKYPQSRQVLQPKSTGFITALNSFRGCNQTLHDITVAYDDDYNGRLSETDFLRGKFPRAVHIKVDVLEIDSFSDDPVIVEEYLRRSFIEKESLLAGFYESLSVSRETRQPADLRNWPPVIHHEENSALAIAAMMLAITVVFLGLVFYSWARWYAVLAALTAVLLAVPPYAFDQIELSLSGFLS